MTLHHLRASTRAVRKQEDVLRDAVLREFDGGWNVIDNELSLRPKYAKTQDNLVRRADGSLSVRFGTKLFSDLEEQIGEEEVVNVVYFQAHVIAVITDGRVFSVDSLGEATERWSDKIANTIASIGDWTQPASFTIGEVWRDSDLDTYWRALTSHSNSAGPPLTFADWRAANPGNWIEATEGWTTTDFASFATFHDALIICNGVDKPLSFNLLAVAPCLYLADAATGSNGNVPICRYVVAVDEFLVMAGDPLDPGRVHISNKGTAGTWPGDPAPNNATVVDVDKYVHASDNTIQGIARFRTVLVVAFEDVMAIGQLDVFDTDGNHTPNFDDVIEAHGAVSHRSMIHLGNDLLLCDNVGVPAVSRSIFSQTLTPSRPSELIDPELQRNIQQLSVGTATKDIFAVYNQTHRQYWLFMPNQDGRQYALSEDPFVIPIDQVTFPGIVAVTVEDHSLLEGESITFAGATGFNTLDAGDINTTHTVHSVIDEDTFTIIFEGETFNLSVPANLIGGGDVVTMTANRTETLVYVLRHRSVDRLVGARSRGASADTWSRFRGWNFRCGCRSLLGRLFFAQGNKIYVYGSEQDQYYEDFLDENEENGVAIDFDWELPWTAFGERNRNKEVKHIGVDAKGRASYTIEMFTDFLKDDAFGEEAPGAAFPFQGPGIQVAFAGGDIGGYGAGSQPYGGGRRSSNERLFSMPIKGMMFKFRMRGSAREKLRIAAVRFLYTLGSMKR